MLVCIPDHCSLCSSNDTLAMLIDNAADCFTENVLFLSKFEPLKVSNLSYVFWIGVYCGYSTVLCTEN